MTDLEIAKSARPKALSEIAEKLGLDYNDLEPYGKSKAKVPLHLMQNMRVKGKLILVTAISPTPAGEGKTTTTIGLTDGLNSIGKQATAVIREPSLGPVFGMKGGAAGGGHAQVIPMEDINLHFTGDFSAIEKANNLLAALIDNNIQSKSQSLRIDPRTVIWKRVMDMNDRALRNIVTGLGGKSGGVPRESGFNITAASEVMAILCLSNDLEDLKNRLGNIYIGDTFERKPVFAKDLKAEGAMAMLMKDAINPNLVQTLEGNPAIVHGGPFANIAQGTNSLIATKTGLKLSDYVVTEAGFGADLGAEKFLDIKCRAGNLQPSAVVLVATLRALKYHGGVGLSDLLIEDVNAVEKGFCNLEKHIETVQHFGLPVVVAINRFSADTEEEVRMLKALCKARKVRVAESFGFAQGSKGCEDLAREVVSAAEERSEFRFLYDLEDTLEEKILKVAQKAYGAGSVGYTSKARAQMRRFDTLGFGLLPICIAKTQKSLSDDEKIIGRPKDFEITIREFEIATGAGFIIPIAGNMLRMPGLPEVPAAENMDVNAEGEIVGLS